MIDRSKVATRHLSSSFENDGELALPNTVMVTKLKQYEEKQGSYIAEKTSINELWSDIKKTIEFKSSEN